MPSACAPRSIRIASSTSTGRRGSGRSAEPAPTTACPPNEARARGQRPIGRPRDRAAGAAARRPARPSRADGRQALLRGAGVRHVHGARRRPAGFVLLLPRGRRRRPQRAHGRGPRRARRLPAPRGRLHASRGAPVRLLHTGNAPDGGGAARDGRAHERGGGQAKPQRQSLPLHGLPRDCGGGLRPRRGGSVSELVETAARGAVGQSVPRRDAGEKLRGQAQFAGDIVVPRMAHGKVLRSPVAHARIVSIDASEAERLAGVVCVLTAKDLEDIDPYWGHAIKDRPVVAIDRVRFAGEPVAAVAAEDEATALAALERIHVEYEDLPVLGTVEQALADDAPPLHDGPLRPGLFHGLGELEPAEGNVCYRYRIDRGEPEAVFAHAQHVVDGEYNFPAVYQYAMETHTVVAQVEGDEITLW